MLKAKNVDITGGPILKSIILYAIPVIIGSLLQVLFNSADLMVLKQMSGDAAENATASVGATAVIVSFVVNTFVGLSAGTSVLFARAYGARNVKKTKLIVNTSIISAFVIGLIVSAILILSAYPFLRITKCPEQCVQSLPCLPTFYQSHPLAESITVQLLRIDAESLRNGKQLDIRHRARAILDPGYRAATNINSQQLKLTRELLLADLHPSAQLLQIAAYEVFAFSVYYPCHHSFSFGIFVLTQDTFYDILNSKILCPMTGQKENLAEKDQNGEDRSRKKDR